MDAKVLRPMVSNNYRLGPFEWLVSLVERERGCVTWAGFYCHCRVRDHTTPTTEPTAWHQTEYRWSFVFLCCMWNRPQVQPFLHNEYEEKTDNGQILWSCVLYNSCDSSKRFNSLLISVFYSKRPSFSWKLNAFYFVHNVVAF